jgi:Spx/MgsR family transcriptional regulator
MVKLFGIPNCDTVKKARVFLEKNKIDVEFVDLKKYRPQMDDINRWSNVFGGLPVNSKGVTYKKHKDQFEKLSEQDKVKFIQDNTSMIKRPILENNGKVLAFGFDEEQFKKIIKSL